MPVWQAAYHAVHHVQPMLGVGQIHLLGRWQLVMDANAWRMARVARHHQGPAPCATDTEAHTEAQGSLVMVLSCYDPCSLQLFRVPGMIRREVAAAAAAREWGLMEHLPEFTADNMPLLDSSNVARIGGKVNRGIRLGGRLGGY